MVMALKIQAESARLQVVAGYESGHTMVFVQSDPCAPFQRLYAAQTHSQPILSIAILPSRDCFLSSSADAVIAKHPLPVAQSVWNTELKPFKVIQTKHSGQQGLDVRSDGRIFATAGWDARVRVYSCKTMKELAVLKWHKVGCYATAFAELADCCPVKMEERLQIKREDEELPTKREDEEVPIKQEEVEEAENQDEGALTHQPLAVTTVQQRREVEAQSTHWLAAASKDGKVSLWIIY
ncbi:MAG: hypothetical protein LQ352_006102, partial [Teloschistes flavicans]